MCISSLTGVLRGSTTLNEQNVTTALNGFFNNGGALPSAFLALYGLNGSALSSALSQASGEVGATSALPGTQMMNAFLSQMLNPYSGAPGSNPGSIGYARAFGAGDNPLPAEAADAYAAVMPSGEAPVRGCSALEFLGPRVWWPQQERR